MIVTKYVVVNSKGTEMGTFTDANEANIHDKKIEAMEKLIPVLSSIPALSADEAEIENIAMALVERKTEVMNALSGAGEVKVRKPRGPNKRTLEKNAKADASEGPDADTGTAGDNVNKGAEQQETAEG